MEKEVSEAERRVKIKKTYSEKIALMVKQDIDDKELYGVIRRFFADFLKLEYEFTYEELSQELNKIFIKQGLKKKIDKMLDDLSWFEYMPDHELSQEEKKKILNDFKEMISQLILDLEEKPGKVSFFDKLFGKKKEESVFEQQDTPEIPTQTLPDLDIGDVQQKNLEMKKELQKEMIAREEPKTPFGNIISSIQGSNNILLVNDSIQNDMPENPENLVMPEDTSKRLVNMSFLSLEDNDPELIAIKEAIAQSYAAFYARDIESAKIKYMSALDIYNKFDYDKKTKMYLQLYDLYQKLK